MEAPILIKQNEEFPSTNYTTFLLVQEMEFLARSTNSIKVLMFGAAAESSTHN
jgi:hypothetical protein